MISFIVSVILLASVVDIYRAYIKTNHFRNEIKEMFGQGLGNSMNNDEIEQLIENDLNQS